MGMQLGGNYGVERTLLEGERLLSTLEGRQSETVDELGGLWVQAVDELESSETFEPLPWHFCGKDRRFIMNFDYCLPVFFPQFDYYFELSTGREGQWDAVNPQVLIILNGNTLCGIDTNHRRVYLDAALGNTRVSLQVHFYTGMQAGDLTLRIKLIKRSKQVHKTYWDLKVIVDSLRAISNMRAPFDLPLLASALSRVLDTANFGSSSDTMEAFEGYCMALSDNLVTNCYAQTASELLPYQVFAVGHTHIDVAWLWDLKQTQEKVVRSYATALDLQKRYPEYSFMASQPLLYELVEEADQGLMQRIKKATHEGLWESEGGMYLEADCNLSGGESLIRQFAFGQQYFKEHFGTLSRTLWLPDVFGYSAALPQILKGFGIELFVTSKISWNDTNTLPYDAFLWQGIDGSRISSQFITTASIETLKKGDHRTIYEGNLTPSEVLGSVLRNQQKAIQPNVLMPFGYGDGGGGATEDMLEIGRRLQAGVKGMPALVMSSLSHFVDTFTASNLHQLPVWRGELYLEYHRGTYTTNGGIKRRYRQLEDLLLFAELVGAQYFLKWPSRTQALMDFNKTVEQAWKILLLNGFHDILPGTSIEKVYIDAYRQLDEAATALALAVKSLGDYGPDSLAPGSLVRFMNPTNQVLVGPVPVRDYGKEGLSDILMVDNKNPIGPFSTIDGLGTRVLGLNALKFEVISPSEGELVQLETSNYAFAFNHMGDLVALSDKHENRSVLRPDSYGLRLRAYEDRPLRWDAWDIDRHYKMHSIPLNIVSIKIAQDCEHALVVRVEKVLNKSSLIQSFVFYKKVGYTRIDVNTTVDWHEHQVLLRAEADLNLNASQAYYDIQFGSVWRPNDENTPYHQAMFEVCAQHWASLAEGNYAVTFMSNEKFGYNALGTELGISLLKSPSWPNANSDQGCSTFSYAILPMAGGFDLPRVHGAAMLYCKGIRPLIQESQNATDPMLDHLAKPWSPKLPSNIDITSFRYLGNGELELRLNEVGNQRGRFELLLPESIQGVDITDLKGTKINSQTVKNGSITLHYRPFELITLRLSWSM